MKKITYSYIMLLTFLVLAVSCNREDEIVYPGTPPVLSFESEQITGTINQEITIKGTASDEFGLKDLIVLSSGVKLNKRLEISDNRLSNSKGINSSFEFEVKHKIPTGLTLTEYDIQVKCNNLTGQSTERTIKLLIQ